MTEAQDCITLTILQFVSYTNPMQVSNEFGYTSIYNVSCMFCLRSVEYPVTYNLGPKLY